MHYKVEEIIRFMENWAKPEYEEDWDNSGVQILFENSEIENIVVALDLTDEVVDMAIEKNVKLIITHHPMFFNGLKSIRSDEYIGKNVIRLIENKITVYSAHTTLDIAEEGVNDTISKLLNLREVKGLYKTEKGYYIGRTGLLEKEMPLEEFIEFLKLQFNINNLRIYGKLKESVKKVSLCGGAGADFIRNAIDEKSDIYFTGDVKHHEGQLAYENNLIIVDIGHYNSEKIIVEKIKEKLLKDFKLNIYTTLKNSYEIDVDDI
ncbi:Nif3-like dinuclear metal center hexameric protein [Anaerosphaera multitolerans]|uniref:GTP cyclohydrolase 1 type 2 homolog n=1 Tax=Anaerosphaera multitolerans TaxID=2487351 RepID=A0A437S8H5_9FIRM|nr:Nif3-like dinuclear metal center hexameric protein [Anaerosphaera multitolerans]RVU55312.1 Nif3-like dinuclear metal center hexameric protein [Anaerosphaera multitolerans]